MTAPITGVFSTACHWPLEKAINPISLMYCNGDLHAIFHVRGVTRSETWRGPQGEPTVGPDTTYEPGQLWERLAERS